MSRAYGSCCSCLLQDKEAAERSAAEAEEARRQAIIEEERERLLAQAGDLRKYLPHAVLVNKKQLPPLLPAFLD